MSSIPEDTDVFSDERLEALKDEANRLFKEMTSSIKEAESVLAAVTNVSKQFYGASKDYVKILQAIEAELHKSRF